MDNPTDKGSEKKETGKKLDLSGLQDFNFASNWSESTQAPARNDREGRHQGGGDRRERRPDRRPSAPGDARSGGGERTERREQRPDRRDGDRPGRRQEPQAQVLLRESPFEIQIFPEEPILAKLTNAMRHSLRTYELFEVCRLVLEKPDRFQVSLRFHGNGGESPPLFQSVPDGLPFLSEEAAVEHVFRIHLDKFFTIEEVEVEPPKGSFQFIARCTLTGEFLSPPNYHRYQSILLQYHQERFPNMHFERFRAQVETVKDEEGVQKWLESMTKQTHYKLIGASDPEAPALSSPEEARSYLVRQLKEQVVRPVRSVRFPGSQIEELSSPDIRPYVVAYLELQNRFPLETANILRGRLRRQHFFIYKKGSRGVSLVCAVKRRFRQANQVFSDFVQALIDFLEKNDQIHASQLVEQFLGVPPTAEGETAATPDGATQERIKRLSLDLRWLLSEGYVTELSDGRLSVHQVAAVDQERPVSKKPAESVQAKQPPAAEASAGGQVETADAAVPPEVESVVAESEEPQGASEAPAVSEPAAEEVKTDAAVEEPVVESSPDSVSDETVNDAEASSEPASPDPDPSEGEASPAGSSEEDREVSHEAEVPSEKAGEEAPEEVSPEEVASEEVAPEEVSSEEVSSEEVAPEEVASEEEASSLTDRNPPASS